MSKPVFVDEEECIRLRSYGENCPEVFQMKEVDEKAKVINLRGVPKS